MTQLNDWLDAGFSERQLFDICADVIEFFIEKMEKDYPDCYSDINDLNSVKLLIYTLTEDVQ